MMLLIVTVASSQNQNLEGQFTGKNLDKSFINVINLNQYKATISKKDGRFEIPAKVGDSILISSIQYVEVKFLVKSEFFEETIEIPLKLKVNELNDVNVYSLGFTGDLAKDAQSIKTQDFSQTQFGFAPYIEYYTPEERRLAVASGSSLDYLINLINGNIKMYKKLVEYERIDKNQGRLFNLFSDKFFIEDLNIPDSLIEDFAYYCVENHPEVIELSQKQDKLMLVELLPKLAKTYNELKETEKDKTQKIDD
mgnify:CR=1 FL=1